jgi:hypothetical protein
MVEEELSEDWRTICAMIVNEKDPARLLQLVKRLNNALDKAFSCFAPGKLTEEQVASTE